MNTFQPQCTPGWELLETWLGAKTTGVRVWVEYQTFTDDGEPFANVYHCHFFDPMGCRKVLIGEDGPFSDAQIKQWEAEAVAADTDDYTDDMPATYSGHAAELAADAYEHALDAQHYANRRAA